MTADEDFTAQPDTSTSVIADVSATVPSETPAQSEDAAMEAAWAKMNPHENVERGEDGKFKADGDTKPAELEGAAEGEEGKEGNSAVAVSDVPLPSNLYGLDDVWAAMPPETRQKLAERSNELNARMSDMGRQVSQAKPLIEAADKFSTYFNSNLKHPDGSNVTPASAVEYLFGIQAAMDKDAPGTLMGIIDTYGARDKIAAMLGVQAAPVDHTNRELLSKIDRLESLLAQGNDPSRVEQIIETRELRSEGQRLKDSEPLVKDIPAKRWDFFVSEGVEHLGENATVKSVFDYAVKAATEADPALRAKTQAARKAAEGDKQKAEAAKRATGVNVTSTSNGASRPMSDDQAMEQVWARHH